MLKTYVLAAIAAVLLLIGGVALAQPRKNINPGRHPNLAAAQDLAQRAWNRIVAAQEANEWDMQGHAQKAKNLLGEANQELRMAANAANRNAR